MIAIQNEGASIASTTYWSTENAREGFLYLSINAATLRILVPMRTAVFLLAELPSVGTPCELHRSTLSGHETYQLLWLDDPEAAYAVEIDQRQCDRGVPAAEDGRVLSLVWYVAAGAEGVREVRREQIQLGAVEAS